MYLDNSNSVPSRTVVLNQPPNAYHLRLRNETKNDKEKEKEKETEQTNNAVEQDLYSSQMLPYQEIEEALSNQQIAEEQAEQVDRNFNELLHIAEVIYPHAARLASNPIQSTYSIAGLISGGICVASGGTAIPAIGAIAVVGALYNLAHIDSKPSDPYQAIKNAQASAEIIKKIQSQTLDGIRNVDKSINEAENRRKEIEEQRKELAKLAETHGEELSHLLERSSQLIEKFKKLQINLGTVNRGMQGGIKTLVHLMESQEELLELLKSSLGEKSSKEDFLKMCEQFKSLVEDGSKKAKNSLAQISEAKRLLNDVQRASSELDKEFVQMIKEIAEAKARAEYLKEKAADNLLIEAQRIELEKARADNDLNRRRVEIQQKINNENIEELRRVGENGSVQLGLQTVAAGLGAGLVLLPFGGVAGVAGGIAAGAAFHNRRAIGQVINLNNERASSADVSARGFSLFFNSTSTGLYNNWYHNRPSRTEGVVIFNVGQSTFECPFDLNDEEAISKETQGKLIEMLETELERDPTLAQDILNLIEDLRTIAIDRRYPDEIKNNCAITINGIRHGLVKGGVLFEGLELDCEESLKKESN